MRTADTIAKTTDFTSSQVANISGWIREHQKETIDSNLYKRLLELKTPTVAEKAEKIFRYLVSTYPVAGMSFEITQNDLSNAIKSIGRSDLLKIVKEKNKKLIPLLAVSWTESSNEFFYIFDTYLSNEKNYLSTDSNKKITPKGWAYWESLKYVNVDSQMAFIAMWFNKKMDSIYNTFHSSIENAGYEPKRVDKTEHINRIDDEIIALIRQSKFIVADYTGQRGGVYFESGYALGLGLPVVWLCKEEDRENLHFDTNHFNFIFWEENKPDQLRDALEKRIIAVIGKGIYHSD